MTDEKPPCGAPETMSILEAAEHLGLAPKTIRRWIAAGKVPKIQPGGDGGKIFVRVDDLLRASQESSDDIPQTEDDR